MKRRTFLATTLALPTLSLPIPSFAFRETAEQIAGFWPDDIVKSKESGLISVVDCVMVMRKGLTPDGKLSSIWHVDNGHTPISDYPPPPSWDEQEISVYSRHWNDSGVACESMWSPQYISCVGRNLHYPECRANHPLSEYEIAWCDCGRNAEVPSRIEVNAEIARQRKMEQVKGFDDLIEAERKIIARRLTSL